MKFNGLQLILKNKIKKVSYYVIYIIINIDNNNIILTNYNIKYNE